MAKKSLCESCRIKGECGPVIGAKVIMESDIVLECTEHIKKEVSPVRPLPETSEARK